MLEQKINNILSKSIAIDNTDEVVIIQNDGYIKKVPQTDLIGNEVDILLPNVGTPTAINSNLEWDSTKFGGVKLDYIGNSVAFNSNTNGIMGTIRIMIKGNSTANVLISDDRFNSISPPNVEFSVDVLTNKARLLYQSDSQLAIKFFNIKYIPITQVTTD